MLPGNVLENIPNFMELKTYNNDCTINMWFFSGNLLLYYLRKPVTKFEDLEALRNESSPVLSQNITKQLG